MKKLFIILPLAFLMLTSCTEDDLLLTSSTPDAKRASSGKLKLDFTGLENLGSSAQYEGWIIVNGTPVSTGTFTVNNGGNPTKKNFFLDRSDLMAATTFVLTIEPIPDNDPAPSATHIFAGNFSGSSADLDVSHPAALGDDYSSSTGGFILATPTDGAMNTNENSGVWFLDPSGPSAGLSLPTLPAGWLYEGWSVINGMPVTTGTFTDVNAVDHADPYSGNAGGPPFPGEDFLFNAPGSLTFPTDLSGSTMVISIEPSPDNSPMPFTLKPLVGMTPINATDHVSYGMNNNAASFPTGTASRK